MTPLLEKLERSAAGLCTENPHDYMARGISAGDCLEAAALIRELVKALRKIRLAYYAAHIAHGHDPEESAALNAATAALSKATLSSEDGK